MMEISLKNLLETGTNCVENHQPSHSISKYQWSACYRHTTALLLHTLRLFLPGFILCCHPVITIHSVKCLYNFEEKSKPDMIWYIPFNLCTFFINKNFATLTHRFYLVFNFSLMLLGLGKIWLINQSILARFKHINSPLNTNKFQQSPAEICSHLPAGGDEGTGVK